MASAVGLRRLGFFRGSFRRDLNARILHVLARLNVRLIFEGDFCEAMRTSSIWFRFFWERLIAFNGLSKVLLQEGFGHL